MKNSNYKLVKVTFILVLFILSSKSYSQELFKDSNLFILEKIAFKCNSKNFKKCMKELNYISYSESANFYGYINKYGDKITLYISENQLEGISISELTNEDIERIKEKLIEKSFIEVQETSVKRFKKEGYPLSFVIHETRDCRTTVTAYIN